MKWPWHRTARPDYTIFTTAFDVELSAEALRQSLTPGAHQIWQDQIAAFETATEVERTKAALNGLTAVDQIHSDNPGLAADTAVSVLVDHSGSLRGQKAMIVCLLVEMLGDILTRTGVIHEILGFTTVAWQGGNARQLWRDRGSPRNPGRLNDLLHIRYKEAGDPNPATPWAIRHILRSDLLKENIDGEAVLWASERLKTLNKDRNILLVISDGAPVDDSTLNENPAEFLWDHLLSVLSDLNQTPGFSVAGIGVDHDVSRLYDKALKIDRLDQISQRVPGFVVQMLR